MAFMRGTGDKQKVSPAHSAPAAQSSQSTPAVQTVSAQTSKEAVKLKAKKWVLVKAFQGEPKDSDIELQEEELQPLKQNEFLCEAVYLSVDPYMRMYMTFLPSNTTVIGQQLAKVTESKNTDYPVGSHILGQFGWRTHTVVNPTLPSPMPHLLLRMPDVGDLPKSLTLGSLGMPGLTAYFGLHKVCQIKTGDVVLVNAAAGAVGHMVGQIAKIQGCRVVGCAGTDAKCSWLKDDLCFDHVFNYKKVDLDKALKEAAPQGFDCYFDNVGGQFTATVINNHMKKYGRVAICGSISEYNLAPEQRPTGIYPWRSILSNELQVSGFIVTRFYDERESTVTQLAQWVREGKIKYREHVTDGFENMRSAFYGMLKGDNTGKAVVKV